MAKGDRIFLPTKEEHDDLKKVVSEHQANDTKHVTQSDKDKWNDISSDAGWINLTLINGVESFNENTIAQYRKVGKTVFLSGALRNITSPVIVGSLPSGFRPSVQSHQFAQNTSSITNASARFARWQIGTNGNIEVQFVTDNTFSASHWFPIHTSFLVD